MKQNENLSFYETNVPKTLIELIKTFWSLDTQ